MTTDNPMKSHLNVEIVDGKLTISIGLALLAFAVQSNDNMWPDEFAITNLDAFGKSMVWQLQREEEDGTTPVHRMLDSAAYEAIESGDDGIDEASVEDGLAMLKPILDN